MRVNSCSACAYRRNKWNLRIVLSSICDPTRKLSVCLNCVGIVFGRSTQHRILFQVVDLACGKILRRRRPREMEWNEK